MTRETVKEMAAAAGRGDFRWLLLLTFAGYALLEKTGVFRLAAATWREVLHSLPARIIAVLLVINAASALAGACSARESRSRTGRVLVLLSLIALCAALWTSYLTRFEGKAYRVEGQSFSAFVSDYDQQSLHVQRYASLPQVGLLIKKIEPQVTPDLKKVVGVGADVDYSGRTTRNILHGRIGSRWPLISDWTLVTVTDFGGAVKYSISDMGGKEIDAATLLLKIFPPGAEDFFSSFSFGYFFHLRCYPDYVDEGGKPSTRSIALKNPMFNIRVARHKDLIYNGLLRPGGKLVFDKFVLLMPDVKYWVEIRFVRDLGLPVAAAGVILLLAGLLATAVGSGRRPSC